jgi:CHAD domain-containing protein
MNFRLYSTDTLAKNLGRIFLSEMENARTCVANDGRLSDKEIHTARKSIKRARATLRLLRPAMPSKDFKRINLALRDVARPLTHVRDAKVLLDALDDLRRHYGDATDCIATDALEHALHTQRGRARRDISASSTTVSDVRGSARSVELEAKHWKLGRDDWDLLRRGLNRIYRTTRAAHRHACEAPSDERLHEWRKQVKHLLHAMQILTPLRPGRIGEIADQAHTLADYLGDDHDLAILRKQLDSRAFSEDEEEDENSQEMLEALIDKRRKDLQDRAFAVGQRLFDAKPKRLLKSIKRYWRAWSDESKGSNASHAPAPPSRRSRPARRVSEPVARLH